jgi:hypothetical protein
MLILPRQINSDDVIMAFLTNPQVDDYSMPFLSLSQQYDVALRWFKHHGVTDLTAAMQELEDFRCRRSRFAESERIWEIRKNISTFWAVSRFQAPQIGDLAYRLAHTPANTVPAERSFSNLKIIHSIIRNRLTPARVKKLLYIYMNSRVLERLQRGKHPMPLLIEKEFIELEDELLALADLEGDGSISVPNFEANEVE